MTTFTRIVLALCLCVGTIACATDDGAAPPSPSPTPDGTMGDAVHTSEVRIEEFAYHPEVAAVSVGTTVTWTNEDFFGHTVTSGTPDDQTETFDGVLGEVADAEGTTFSFAFPEAGSFEYFCRFHPSMRGRVFVE